MYPQYIFSCDIISTWLKKGSKYYNQILLQKGNVKRYRQHKGQFIDLEIQLKEIILERDTLGLSRDQQWISEKAKEIYNNNDNNSEKIKFNASKGWFYRFLERNPEL